MSSARPGGGAQRSIPNVSRDAPRLRDAELLLKAFNLCRSRNNDLAHGCPCLSEGGDVIAALDAEAFEPPGDVRMDFFSERILIKRASSGMPATGAGARLGSARNPTATGGGQSVSISAAPP